MKKVLSFGYLKTDHQERDLGLKGAGLDVTAVGSTQEALAALQKHHFDVLIVGPAVPQQERDRVAGVAKSRHIRVVFLYKHSINGSVCGDAVISSDSSPADLIETVKSLIA